MSQNYSNRELKCAAETADNKKFQADSRCMSENLHLLMSCPAAARRLGVSTWTLRRMIALGSLETVYLHPKAHPRVRRTDVEALARGERAEARP